MLIIAVLAVAPADARASRWHACGDLAEKGAAGGVPVPKNNPFAEDPVPLWQGPATDIRAQAMACADVHAQLRLWLTEDRFPPTWPGFPEADTPPGWVCGVVRARVDCLSPADLAVRWRAGPGSCSGWCGRRSAS
jgi:hypothetical protein